MAIHPTIGRAKKLRRASAGAVLVEPQTNAIGANQYSERVGFGGAAYDVEILFKADAGAGDGITIETSATKDFAVVTVPEFRLDPPFYGGLIDAAGFLNGQQITIKNLEGAGWWRIKNGVTGSIEVGYAAKPNR